MLPETSTKPGCFGSPLCYSDTVAICSRCNFAGDCAAAAKERASGLMEKYGIKALLRKAIKKEPAKVIPFEKPKSVTRAQTPKREQLLQKLVSAQFDMMATKGINLKSSVENRENPFDKSSCAFLHETIEVLLSGGVSAATLNKQFQTKLKMGDATAQTYTEVAIRVLLRSGAGEREMQRWTIVPCHSVEDIESDVSFEHA